MNSILHAIAAPRRREILTVLGHDERTAGEIHRAVGQVTFGAISQHLKVLCEAGLVTRRKRGRERCYRCRPEGFRPLADWLGSMWDRALFDLARLSEHENDRTGDST